MYRCACAEVLLFCQKSLAFIYSKSAFLNSQRSQKLRNSPKNMPVVFYVSFESIRGKRCYEGIFISRSLDLNQVSFCPQESASSSSQPSSSSGSSRRNQNIVQVHDSLSNNVPLGVDGSGQHAMNTTSREVIEGTFIELFVRKDRSSSRLKIQHFFKLNDRESQQMICLRQVGKTTSIPEFFAFLRTIPLPTLVDQVSLIPNVGQSQMSTDPYARGALTSYYTINGAIRYEKTLKEVAREWYIMVIREAERQQILRRWY